MTVNAAKLNRAVNVSTASGDCLLCAGAFRPNEVAERVHYPELNGAAGAFYLTLKRLGSGQPDFRPEAQVEPGVAKVAKRPVGCTCKGKRAHGKKCALFKACKCRTAKGKYGSYQKHSGGCGNKLNFGDVWGTLPGYREGFAHADCADRDGFVVPSAARKTWGRRTLGMLDTTGPNLSRLARQELSAARGKAQLVAHDKAQEAAAEAAQAQELEAFDNARGDRFRRVVEAAWDETPNPTPAEEGPDASVERFKLLDLD